MPSKLDKCVEKVKKKIDEAKIKKYYRCDAQGNPNPKGKKRCKTSAHAICKESLK